MVCPSGAELSSSTVRLLRATTPPVTCRPPPRVVATLSATRVPTRCTVVLPPETERAPPSSASLRSRALCEMSTWLPAAATTPPPKLPSKRLPPTCFGLGVGVGVRGERVGVGVVTLRLAASDLHCGSGTDGM